MMNVKIRTQAQPQNELGRETQVRQYRLTRARYDVEARICPIMVIHRNISGTILALPCSSASVEIVIRNAIIDLFPKN